LGEHPVKRKRTMEMSHLVIDVFDNEGRAGDVLLDLVKERHEPFANMTDAVVLVRRADGSVRMPSMTHLTIAGAVSGGFLGSLLGVVLLNPVFALMGLAAGTFIGAFSGPLYRLGIGEDFMKELARHLRPGTSALCFLVREKLETALARMEGYGGKVLTTPIVHDPEEEQRLLEELDHIGARTPETVA
jgi:uncharacterized membrane protein